jgi:hypothetical protein
MMQKSLPELKAGCLRGVVAMIAKSLLKIGAILVFLCASGVVTAQSSASPVDHKAALQALAEQLRQRDAADRKQVREFARGLGIPIRRELPNGRILELQRIAPGIGPVFYITNNVDAADTVSTDEVWPGGSAGLDLDGSGMILGEWDGGAVFSEHPDFDTRLTQVDGATLVSEHSTHVAGTLIGNGELLAEARGMAYAADLHAYDWISDTAEMASAAAGGLLASNHSYGIAAGWLYIGDTAPDTWWWIGGADPADVEDPNFGYYDAEAQLWDQIAFDAPWYLIVKAAGNDRSDIGPSPGEEYTVIDQSGKKLFTSTLPRQPDCAPAGYDCMPGHSVAKNILTVGAVDDLIGGYSPLAGPSAVSMLDFSSWGPTDDGRIKPDLVGNGMLLTSAWPDYPYWVPAIGTSMAAPNVTGSLILLQQHYQDIHGGGNFMRAATLKALAIHTADEAGDADGPDYEFGWGLLNTRSAAEVITQDGGDHMIIEGTLFNTATDTIEVNVSEDGSILKATLVWMDPPGTPAAPSLDPTDLMLVNDLDLRITKGPASYLPWVLDPATPAAAASKGDNFRDNVEQVVAENGGAGTYYVKVRHKGVLLNGDPQDYSLITSILPPPPTGSSLLIDEDFSGGLPSGWSVDTEEGVPWTINTPVVGDPRLDNLTGGSGLFAIVDNRYARTRTSLVTPTLDLSSATAVILRFKSNFLFDFLESINVDVTTNGGSSWPNVWTYQGFNPNPTPYVLDLTGQLAGQASAQLRFRFDSHGDVQGNYWQVDDVEVEVFGGSPLPPNPPAQATDPDPQDGAISVAIDSDLSWIAGADATSHDVYFGGNFPLNGGDFEGNQGATAFAPGALDYNTTYYWRIDEVNDSGTTTGTVWSFSTEAAPLPLPGQAFGALPANGAVGIGINSDLAWTAGSDAASHDVYFGTVSPPPLQGNQLGTAFDPGTLANSTTYYWRIDEVNGTGTTDGTEWSFTTEAVAPPAAAIHLKSLTGGSIQRARGRWSATVQIEVVDDGGTPAADVLVEGDWSNGANGAGSCTTNGTGLCQVQKDNVKSSDASVDFSVNGLSGADMTYSPAANEVAASITVFRDGGVGNLLPDAVNDSYSTTTDTPVGGNVLSNDSLGDTPTVVSAFDAASAQGGAVTMSSMGIFTYTPPAGFEGQDSFGYTIRDSDNDSDSAIVSFEINPDAGGALTLSVSASRIKGEWYADLSWSGAAGTEVTISRNGGAVIAVPNSGTYSELLGKHVSGSYLFEVCESGGGACAQDTLQL